MDRKGGGRGLPRLDGTIHSKGICYRGRRPSGRPKRWSIYYRFVFDQVETELYEKVETRPEWQSVRRINSVKELRVVTDPSLFECFWKFDIDWQKPSGLSLVDFHYPTACFDFSTNVSSHSGKRLLCEALRQFCSMMDIYMGVECASAVAQLAAVLEDGPRMEGIHDIYVFFKVNKALSKATRDTRCGEPLPGGSLAGATAFVSRLTAAFDAVSLAMPEQGAVADFSQFYSSEFPKVMEWPSRRPAVSTSSRSVTPQVPASSSGAVAKPKTEKNRRKAEKRKVLQTEGKKAVEAAAKLPRMAATPPHSVQVKAESSSRESHPGSGPCPYHVAHLLGVTKRDGEVLACRFQSQSSCSKGNHGPLQSASRAQTLASVASSLKDNHVIRGIVHSAVTDAAAGSFKDE